MAKVRVKIEGKSVVVEVFLRRGYGGPVFDENPLPGSIPWHPPHKPRGRPRKDEKAARISELRDNEKKSWRSVGMTATREFQETTGDAARSLYRSRKRAPNGSPMGTLEQTFLQLIQRLQPRTLRLPQRRGRPRKDEIRFEGIRMRREGSTWGQVAIKLNAKYNQKLSENTYRKLCSPAKREIPWRKLDLNFVRGLKSS